MAKSTRSRGKAKAGNGSPLEQLIAKELDKGKKMARDPQNAILRSGVIRVTNQNSEWLDGDCIYCNFKFREEDRVLLCPNCDLPLHQDGRYELKCWSDFFQGKNQCPKCNHIIAAAPPDDTTESPEQKDSAGALLAQNIFEEFSSGIKSEWTMPGEEEGSVAPRVLHSKGDAAYGKKCMICGEGIRVGDRYIECPGEWKCCYHADVLRHLTCWMVRFKMENNDYCMLSGGTCKIELKK